MAMEKLFMQTLGKRIKHIRELLELNQVELAEKLNLKSAMAISKYELDQREPDKDKLVILSELANVSLEWLLTGKGSIRENNHDNDAEINEIAIWLKENPDIKSLFIKLIRANNEINKALSELKRLGFNLK